MSEQNQGQNRNTHEPNSLENRGHGPQGIDKAPGEEPSQDNVQFKQETQQGKQNVDADLEKEQDQALDKQDV